MSKSWDKAASSEILEDIRKAVRDVPKTYYVYNPEFREVFPSETELIWDPELEAYVREEK